MRTPKSIELTYKLKKGEVLNYKTRITSSQKLVEENEKNQENTSVLEMRMRQKITGSDKNTTSVDITITEGFIEKGGVKNTLPSINETISVTMNNKGKILNTSVQFPFNQPVFPDGKITLGHRWTGESVINIPKIDEKGDQKGSIDAIQTYFYTLVGIEQASNEDIVAEIRIEHPLTTLRIQDGVHQYINTMGNLFYNVTTGRMVKSKTKTITKIVAMGAHVTTSIENETDEA